MTDCSLCGLDATEDPRVAPDVPGEYCCPGCLSVARSLADLDEAAADADAANLAGAAPAANAGNDDGDDGLPFARGPDEADGAVRYVSVTGMHCATCEAFLEARATDRDGVLAAAADYPTGTVRVTFDPDRIDEGEIPDAIAGFGYAVEPSAERTGGSASDAAPETDFRDDEQPSVAGKDDEQPSVAGKDDEQQSAAAASGPAGTASGPSRPGQAVSGTTGSADGAQGRLLVGAIFGMMVMGWYALFLYPAYLGVSAEFLLIDPRGPAGTYLLGNVAVFSAIVLGYTGRPVFRGALVSLLVRQPNKDLLVALAATTAFGYSVLAIVLGRVEVYFDVATVVVLAVTVGDAVRDRVRRRAVDRLSTVAGERVETATVRRGDGTETVPTGSLRAGDEVAVAAGERVPLDGTVVDGSGAVSRAVVTGESTPRQREPGDAVLGGARVTAGGLVVAVGEGATSTVDRLQDVAWRARTGRDAVQRLVDRLAAAFVPLVVALAAIALVGHLLAGAGAVDALLIALAVLLVSCPCALGLATPLAVASGLSTALDEGAVVADESVFETAADVDVVALDKTGTLTTGSLTLVGTPDDGALRRAAALEQFADHPIANAVTRAAGGVSTGGSSADRSPSERHSTVADGGVSTHVAVDSADQRVADVETIPGRGVVGTVDGERVVVGSPTLLAQRGLSVPDRLRSACERAAASGDTAALVGWDGEAREVLVARDPPREEWLAAVEELGTNRRLVVLTGDDEAAGAPFADHPAIDAVHAGLPPAAKAATVERLRAEGTVAVVGDGTNDAPALGAADLGVAMGGASALADEAADCVVVDDDLRTVPATLSILTATRSRVRQNLAWALGYNALALPAALAGALSPLVAALAMLASSTLVVANSARELRR